jgi:hypothetical protein
MRAPERIPDAAAMGKEASDGRVDLWADSVGVAARQIGILLSVAMAAHFASSLLLGQ